MGEKLFTIQDAADVLGCSRLTVRRMEKSGRIPPARRISGQRRYSQADLDHLQRHASGLPEEHRAGQNSGWEQPEEEEPESWEGLHLQEAVQDAHESIRDDHGQPVHTARPRQRPWNPFELDPGEEVEQELDAGDGGLKASPRPGGPYARSAAIESPG